MSSNTHFYAKMLQAKKENQSPELSKKVDYRFIGIAGLNIRKEVDNQQIIYRLGINVRSTI